MGDGESIRNVYKEGFPQRDGVSGIIGFYGQPGTGKTFLMGQKISGVQRCCVFNTAGSYGPGEGKNPLPGFLPVCDLADLAELCRLNYSSRRFRVLFNPVGRHDPAEYFSFWLKLMMGFRNVLCAVDEIWNFHSAGYAPSEQKQAFLQWRHYGNPLAYTAQQPQLVFEPLRSVSTEVYCGRLINSHDRKAMGKCGLTDAALNVVAGLPSRAFIHRFPDSSWSIEA